jgi:predicted transcriptional regulator of viral defense system
MKYNAYMKKELGPLETQFFAYVQLRQLKTVRTGQVAEALRLSGQQERTLLNRLSKASLIARVRRGLYLVPPRLPLGGMWTPSEALALWALMEDKNGRYQICGPNAFNRYGFDNQIPTRIYAYNNRISGNRKVGSLAITLIKVADSRLGDTETVPGTDDPPTVYSSRARTLVDAVYDWARFNSLPRALGWIEDELASERVKLPEFVNATVKYGDIGTVRRIGALLDQNGVSQEWLGRLQRRLPATTSWIPWNPAAPKRGRLNRRWAVVINAR